MQDPNIAELTRKLDNIERLLKSNALQCEKMSNHIDFVERVYSYIKAPLFYITDRIHRITGQPSLQLQPPEWTPEES
jgi:wobble nucleotide-excising tRNase